MDNQTPGKHEKVTTHNKRKKLDILKTNTELLSWKQIQGVESVITDSEKNNGRKEWKRIGLKENREKDDLKYQLTEEVHCRW